MNKIKRLSVFICLVLLGAGMVLLAGLDMQHATAAPQPETWFQAASAPSPVAFYGFAQCADEPEVFYVLGSYPGANTFYSYDARTNTWTILANYPIVIERSAMICYGGHIYAAGGNNGSGPVDSFYIFDIAADTWTQATNLPHPLKQAAISAWDGHLYLIGGTISSTPWPPINHVDVYDIASDTWSDQAGDPMPVATDSAGYYQQGRYLYIVGGFSGDFSHNITATQRYDMSENMWGDSGPVFTSARAFFALAGNGSHLYAMGGDADGGDQFDPTDLVESLDLSIWPVSTWVNVADPMPLLLEGNSAGFCSESVSGGEIWSVGGIDSGQNILDDVYYRPTGEPCFDFYFGDLQPESLAATGSPGEIITYTLSIHNDGTLSDTYEITANAAWNTTFPATVGPLAAGESAELLVSVEVPAGGLPGVSDTAVVTATSQGDLAAVDQANITTAVTEWMEEATPIPHRTGLAGYAQCPDDPDHFYVVGGADDWSSATRLVWSYEISTDSWESLAEFPVLRIFTTSTCYQGKIYSYDRGLFIYDIASNTWTIGPFPQRLVEGNALGVWDGKLFVVGGTINNYIPDPRVDIYDIASGTWLAEGGTVMPIGTNFSGWVQAGRYLYISGGWLSISSGTDVTQRYDMAIGIWERASSTLPAEMGASGLVINGGKLYSLGGSTDFVYAPLDQVLVMDLAEWPDGAWEPYYDYLPFANGGMAPFCSEGKTGGEIWSVGGGYSDPDGTAHIFDTNLYHPTSEPCTDFYFGDLLPESLATTGMPGEIITYTLSIHNDGTLSDTYEITANAAWNTTFPATVGPLAAGESAEILVSVEVPAEGLPGESDTAVVTATSQGDQTAADEATITTAVTEWVEAQIIPNLSANSATAQCPADPDSFYVIGGWGSPGTPRQTQLFDADTGDWTTLAEPPYEFIDASAVCYQGMIYVAGGYINNLFAIYNISTNTWAQGPVLPRIVMGAALGAWDGKLYLVGGTDKSEYQGLDPVNQVDMYDIASGIWVPDALPPMPVATSFSGFVQAGPYLYVVGGFSGDYDFNVTATQRLNINTWEWEIVPNFASARAMLAATVTDTHLYAIGGDLNGGDHLDATDQVEQLDLTTWPNASWQDIGDPLPGISQGNTSACTNSIMGGEIWSTGGGYIDDDGLQHVYNFNLYHPAEPCINYDVDLSGSMQSYAEIGSTVYYTLSITNTGTITDWYNLVVSTTWQAGATLGGPGPVEPGETIQIVIGVDVPAEAMPGDQGSSLVTVSSLRDPTIMDTTLFTTTVPKYVVGLSPDSLALDGLRGETITYTLTVSNLGNIADTVSFTYTGNTWEAQLPVTSLDLAKGESASVAVYVTVPMDAGIGETDALNLTATSAGDPSVSDSATLTATAIGYEVGLGPNSLALNGYRGETITYTLTVSNLGNIADTVSFTYTGNTWEVLLPVTSLDLDISESKTVVVYVSVPMDAGIGDIDVLNLTATSAGDPSASDSARLTTTAIGYAVGLTPDSLALSGSWGETVAFTLTVSNLGNIADTVSITYTGNTWEVLLPVTSLDLDIGESAEVVVYVTVPMDAGIGDTDALNLTATSAGDPSVSASSTLTTTATGYRMLLPLAMKNFP